MEPETVKSEAKQQPENLVSVLKSLESEIKKQNSLKHALFRGMIYGLGTVIGATVLVALFGGILATTLSSLTGSTITPQEIEQGLKSTN